MDDSDQGLSIEHPAALAGEVRRDFMEPLAVAVPVRRRGAAPRLLRLPAPGVVGEIRGAAALGHGRQFIGVVVAVGPREPARARPLHERHVVGVIVFILVQHGLRPGLLVQTQQPGKDY